MNHRLESPPRFGSVSTPQPAFNPARYGTRIASSPQHVQSNPNSFDMSALSRGSYPGSPSQSTTSTNSISAASPQSNFEIQDFYSPAMDKYICPMKGCLYSVLGFSTSEELDQHMAVLSHFPEPSSVVNPQLVTILDQHDTWENTEDWLAINQDNFNENVYSTPPPTYHSPPQTYEATYEFTFTYDKKKQFPSKSSSPTSSQCDCQHCQPQSKRTHPATIYPTQRKSTTTKRKSLFDIQTPMTIQMPQPPVILNLPPPPPPPTSNPSRIAGASTSPKIHQYALWQQQIQIAQVTEMLQAQQKQREAQRRKLEADSPNSGKASSPQSGYTIPGEQDYSIMYGYPRLSHA